MNISLRDYSPIENEHIKICEEIQNLISGGNECESGNADGRESLISVINIDGQKSDDNFRIFRFFNEEYWTQEYVGVILYKEHKITIGSRFDSEDRQYFLQYLFSTFFDSKGKIFDKMSVSGKKEHTWDILLFMVFLFQLKTAIGKGIFRQYRQFFHNDSNVKGQIDFAAHIKYNPVFNGKISYRTREFTADNYYNMLILRTFDEMEKKYPQAVHNMLSEKPEVKKALSSLKGNCSFYSSVSTSVILQKTSRRIVNNVYRSYEPLRITSRILLSRLGINVFDGNNSKVCGVLINIARLWEVFLYKIILKDLGFKEQQKFIILGGKRPIKPDFYNSEKHIVIDAKYKRTWGETPEKDPWDDKVREDVFQVMAYMLALDCKKGGVAFPYNKESEMKKEPEKLSVYPENHTPDKYFFRLPVAIPGEQDDFSVFKDKFSENINKIKEALNSLLCELDDKN